MGKNILKTAIIGYGGMGKWHRTIMQEIDGISLCGVYDIDPAQQKEAEKEKIHAYGSASDLLSDPEVQVVTIATPNDTHLPIAIQAMEAGKHVVCEKPVALGSGELAQMIACSEENSVLFTVHQNRRWDEDFLTIKKMYDNNTLGRIFNIESRVQGSRGIPSDWRNKKAQGGGMVLDWGVHLIDQVMLMLKDRKLESIWAQLFNVTNEEVDDGFRVVFQFNEGLSCLIEVGTSNFIMLPRWYVLGENGSCIINDWARNGEIVMVSDWEKRDAVPVFTAAGLTKTMAPRTEETIKKYPLPELKSDIHDYYKNIAAAVFDGAELNVKPAEVMRVMRIMEAIFKSAELNQTVEFE